MAKQISIPSKTGIRLDIGGGGNPQPGFVNMDYRKLPGVDIVHDLETFPWPIVDGTVLTAIASHVVEHINPAKGTFIKFMDEVWRVLKPGASFAIATPYAGSLGYFQDPTHVNPCNEVTWSYFDPLDERTGGQLYRIYKPKPWKIEHLTFDRAVNLEIVLSKRIEDESYTR